MFEAAFHVVSQLELLIVRLFMLVLLVWSLARYFLWDARR
jgi:hypothetical protein